MSTRAGELARSGRELIPITRRAYMGLPSSRREALFTQWKIAFPTNKKTFLNDWDTREEGRPARLSRAESLR